MTPRICVDPTCAEPNPPAATHCHECGKRLVPEERSIDRWRRVRQAVGDTSNEINPDEHAQLVIDTIEEREAATAGDDDPGTAPAAGGIGQSRLPLSEPISFWWRH